MIDTINLIIPNYDGLDLSDRLTDVQEINGYNGTYRGVKGNLDNLSVSCTNHIKLIGSFSKYYLGNNIEPFLPEHTKYAIQKISDSLGVDVNEARVTSLHVGKTMPVNHSPSEYLSLMKMSNNFPQEMIRRNPRTKVLETKKYSKGSSKRPSKRSLKPSSSFQLYDKGAEVRSNGDLLPNGYEAKNLLRMEIQFETRLAKTLKCFPIKAKDLYESKDWRKSAARLWQKAYFGIQKTQGYHLFPASCNILDMRGFFEQVAYQQLGGAEWGRNFLEYRKNVSGISKNQSQRVREKFKRLESSSRYSTTNELIEELDMIVKNSVVDDWIV